LLAQNRWLRAQGNGQPLLTTLSALVLRGRRFTLAHVGDCRVYRWHEGQLHCLSEDHVWDQPGMQHVLKRALGLDQHLLVDYLDGELHHGERFLLLSDGCGPAWATSESRPSCANTPTCRTPSTPWWPPPTTAAARTTPAHCWSVSTHWAPPTSATPWPTAAVALARPVAAGR
jgi:hypothetical protein